MKLKSQISTRYLVIIVLVFLILIPFLYFLKKDNKNDSEEDRPASINNNISPELKNLPNNIVIYLAVKDSFVLPDGYKFDSQIVDGSILIYSKDQKDIQYTGIESLESFQGIFISSAESVKSSEEFVRINEEKIQNFKEINPESDATGQIARNSQNSEAYVVKQTKPYKMIDTILNKEFIIEIASYEETDVYKRIVETYNAAELISDNDHKAIYKLHKNLVEAYNNQDAQGVFALLSSEAQKNNPIEKIRNNVQSDIFKDMISLKPTALYCFGGNFILQSKIIFKDNFMRRLDILLKVDYDGEKNNWLIDSYSIKNKEKYLSKTQLK